MKVRMERCRKRIVDHHISKLQLHLLLCISNKTENDITDEIIEKFTTAIEIDPYDNEEEKKLLNENNLIKVCNNDS